MEPPSRRYPVITCPLGDHADAAKRFPLLSGITPTLPSDPLSPRQPIPTLQSDSLDTRGPPDATQ
ncbi:hypothetical protein DPMN_152302 [Dreissena polymorpha]|uniref:Uncharacterized protein n=1 Tax=Dreissena polymorpha TaxID=45954 RepID=A0A9D4FH81_DREPO|nr:hypothetical protein DPMN_152302 [Dreissena polymorpha]